MRERFTAQILLDYSLSIRGLKFEDLQVAPIVVVCWHQRIVRSLTRAIGAEEPLFLTNGDRLTFYTGEVEGQPVSVAHVPLGAPATVKAMEELIVCGARVFVGFGRAGSLQQEAPVGTFLVPTSCLSEEGTSRHYVETVDSIGPDPRLLDAILKQCRVGGMEAVTGPLWTMDALYRELVDKVETYRQKGVLGVDMETSAMYALGRFRNVAVCNVLLVSDELWREWNPAFGSQELRDATLLAEQVILQCIPEIGKLAGPEPSLREEA
jgi:uridine phosphorylase